MNRTAAAIGLALSLSLHAGLMLLANIPTGPPPRPAVKVALRQLDQPDESAAAITPAVIQDEPRDQPQEQPAQPAAEPPPPVAAEPPRIESEPPPIAPAAPPPKPETVVARPPAPPPPMSPDLAGPPLATEPPPDPPQPADREVAGRPSRSTPDPTPAPPAASTSVPVAENRLSTATQPTGEMTPPSYIPRPRPYPRLAKQRGWEGTVQLQVDIAADGTVTRVQLEQSSGYPILDQSAIRHIGNSRFRPARRNGIPVEISVQLPVVFELK